MVSTIFFDGFGPHGGEHVGQIDPLFWEHNNDTVVLSGYRTDRNQSTVNGTVNGIDFMGHTFGSVVRLNSYLNDSDRTYLKAHNFPNTFANNNTAFGLGFFINKITTDSKDRPNTNSGPDYASKVISIINTDDNIDHDILLLEAIHLGDLGYPVDNPKMGLRVKQMVNGSYETMGIFTFDVWGAPWYTEQNPNMVSTNLQRTIDAYDYKYGGLYIEICVMLENSPSDPTKPYSLQIKANGMNLLVNNTENDKKIYVRDCWNSYGVAKGSFAIDSAGSGYVVGNTFAVTDSRGGSGAVLTVTQTDASGGILDFDVTSAGSKFLALPTVTPDNTTSNGLTKNSISINDGGTGYSDGDTFTVTDLGGGTGGVISVVVTDGVITDFNIVSPGFGFTTSPNISPDTVSGTGAIFDTNPDNFVTVNGSGVVFTTNINAFTVVETLTDKYFNNFVFYGSRVPDDNLSSDPLSYWNGNYNNQFLYHTYIDNVYVVGGLSDQDCFLGPTTKIFNIAPIAGGTVNTDNNWQAFNLQWNTNTSIEDNLKDSNGDRSYAYTEISGAILAMDMANVPSNPNYAIGGIKITNSVRKSNKDTAFINVWGSGSALSDIHTIGTNFPVTDNHYEYKNQYFLTNPITGQPWTFEDVNNGKFGIKKTL